jgi:hypothetical protein
MENSREVIHVYSTGVLLPVDACGNRQGGPREFPKVRRLRCKRGAFEVGERIDEAAVCACSACAGDYEDPDRTAWTPDENDDEDGDDAGQARAEEFPAEK